MTHAANGSTCWSRKDSLNSSPAKYAENVWLALRKFNVYPEEPFDWLKQLVNMFCSHTCTECSWTQVVAIIFLVLSSPFVLPKRISIHALWQLPGQSVTACRDFMIAGQIKRLSSASEPLPGNNKCLGNQDWLGERGVVGSGWAWESDCSVFKLRDTSHAKDGGEFPAGGRKNKATRWRNLTVTWHHWHKQKHWSGRFRGF